MKRKMQRHGVEGGLFGVQFKRMVLIVGALVGVFAREGMCVQMFSDEPSYTEVNPGADDVLECQVDNIGGECRWQKDGKPIGIYPGKYQWAGKPSLGDCSLEILEANITFDDGLWECQVTSSSFASQDALASKPARLVVREPPKSIKIIQNNAEVRQGAQITVVDGQVETLTCESRQSNPPPRLRWYLGDRELLGEQTNVTEEDDERRWKAVSALQHKFGKDDFGKSLACKVEHPAYSTGVRMATVVLDVLYKPKVSIVRSGDDVFEEGRSSVTLRCVADANPPGRVFWRKYGPTTSGNQEEARQYVDTLELKPVTRKDGGTYLCQAENSIGLSNEEPAEIDVQYPPKILRVTPTGGATVGVHNRTILTCSAEGNPLPKYQWLQKLPSQQVLKRGYEDRLVIDETTYDHQGDYVCEAINAIGGQRKIVQSDPIHIEVRGAPQVLRYSVAKKVEAISGRDVRLEMEVCSDPIPSRTTWDWGALRVDAGQELKGRYLAEQMVEHPEREDCYIARLLVKEVSPKDSRPYFLDVENAHGTDRYAVRLTVKDPVSMASVIGVVIALLLLFVVMVVVLLYAYKKQKMCFKEGSKQGLTHSPERHGGFDNEKGRGGHGGVIISGPLPTSNGHHAHNGHNGGPLPPDGMYHVSDSINGIGDGIGEKLWPENHPAYQMYIPAGYHNSTIGHSAVHPSPAIHPSGAAPLRARSTTPTGGADHSGVVGLPGGHGAGNRMLYNDLQFPVTSNYGSMKKRSQRSTANTNSTTVLSSAGEPSPSASEEAGLYHGNGDPAAMAAISLSVDNVHRYVPEYLAISNRKTAV